MNLISLLKVAVRKRLSFTFSKIVLMMQLTTFFMLVACLQVSATAYSQKVTIVGKDILLKKVFKDIRKQTDYNFIYTNKTISGAHPVSLNVKNGEVQEVLKKAFHNQPLFYTIEDGIIIVRKKKNSIKVGIKNPVKITIEGVVKDGQGTPLPGVSIKVVGETRGVVTDEDGRYTIRVNPDDSLKFSFVGYENRVYAVKNRTELNVIMQGKRGSLNELVVVGYGTQKRESVISAISDVDPKVLQSNQSTSLSNALAGQVPGVIAVQRSGEPGYDKSDFWIRGMSTFGANSRPLVLVDGVERDLNSLSPEEIESFTVLKDATATAVYGVRGANGVILITTKTGHKGPPTVTFKADHGILEPTQLPKFVGAPKYMETINIANQLSGLDPLYSKEDIARTRNGYDKDLYPDVNWLDAITRSYATTTNASVDINGGSDRLRYSFVGAYMSETGIITTDPRQKYNSQLGLSKYNLRSNLDFSLTNSTKLSVKIGGYITDRRAPGKYGISSIFSHAMDTPPNYHPKIYSNGQLPKVAARYNPWADATQTGYRKTYKSTLQTQLNLKQDIGALIPLLKGLYGSILASFDAYNEHTQKRSKDPFYYNATGRDVLGNLITTNVEQGQSFLGYSNSASGNRTIYLEGRLNYNRTIDNKHTIDGLFLFNMRDHVDQNASSSILALPYRSMGIAGRAGYNFDHRYFAEFDFGYNGSENFRRGLRYGFFPSFALGWMPSNENFFEPLEDVISKLKFRGSYGLSGNDQIVNNRRFAYISTIVETSGMNFGYTEDYKFGTGYAEGDFGVPNLTWETSKKLDIGMELGLFNGAIQFQADYFNELRSDIFMQRKTIPITAGFNEEPYANFGKVRNRGGEFELQVNKSFSKDLSISARATLTYARNIIIEYDEPLSLKKTTRAHTGKPIDQHFGLVALGLYTASDFKDIANGVLKSNLPVPKFGDVKPGDIRYKDLNGDGIINSFDETAIGDPYVPETVFGFGVNITYKNFDFGFLFQGATNFTNMMNGATLVPGSGGGGTGNVYANVDDRWDPNKLYEVQNNVLWPRLAANESSNNMRYSTWWLVDASYIRLKYAEIGYTLPKSWQGRLLMTNARIYLRGSNLLTFAPFKMWDPEIGSQDGLKYPPNKVVTVGIEFTF